MLYSVELRLRVVGGTDPRRATGYHLYSFFLRLIEGSNPALSAVLHQEGGPKPFTLSLLSPSSPKERRASPGKEPESAFASPSCRKSCLLP